MILSFSIHSGVPTSEEAAERTRTQGLGAPCIRVTLSREVVVFHGRCLKLTSLPFHNFVLFAHLRIILNNIISYQYCLYLIFLIEFVIFSYGMTSSTFRLYDVIIQFSMDIAVKDQSVSALTMSMYRLCAIFKECDDSVYII